MKSNNKKIQLPEKDLIEDLEDDVLEEEGDFEDEDDLDEEDELDYLVIGLIN
jgi:hypothetical protein